MELTFRGAIFTWRGPAPFHFVAVPPDEAALLADLAPTVSYGYGMVPAGVTVGRTSVTTALWPKDGGYVVPLTAAVRRAEGLDAGDEVELTLQVG